MHSTQTIQREVCGNYHWVGHCHHSGQVEEHDSPLEQEPVVDERPHLLLAEAILQKVWLLQFDICRTRNNEIT